MTPPATARHYRAPTTAQSRWSPASTRLLEAAATCFEDYGIAKTTMDDVAKRAGVSRITVYRSFDNREQLIIAVVAFKGLAFNNKLRPILARSATVADAVVEYLCRSISATQRDRMMRELFASDSFASTRAAVRLATPYFDAMVQTWTPILQDAVDRGELSSDFNVDDAVDWIGQLQLNLSREAGAGGRTGQALRDFLTRFVAPAFARS